ncbi:MAG TPA: 30S ribosomal protein S7 [Anaerolineae bacterium]|nr:30S ribosomal protein S7 [Anaerolineae bacterium]
MSRRARAIRRQIDPDLRYNSVQLQVFINHLMRRGKTSIASRIVYDAFDMIEDRSKRAPLEVFEQALKNTMPSVEVKPRRVGGANYQVPVEVGSERRVTLAIRWLLQAARTRAGKSMSEKLAGEFMDAAQNQGAAIKKREETHKMAEANRAYAHFRW